MAESDERHGQLLLRTGMKTSVSSRSAARGRNKKQPILQTKGLSAARLDEMHDAGENLSPYLDFTQARRPGREVQRVNVDFPIDLLHAIDREAKRIGVTRQAFIKLRLADSLPPR